MLKVSPIHAFHDNYIWCIYNPKTRDALVVDPGDASATNQFLNDHDLHLSAILITHHHPDHIGGLSKLKQQHEIKVLRVQRTQNLKA